MQRQASALITDADSVAALRALTWEATRIEAATPHTHLESVNLMRFGRAEIEANPDGIYLGGSMLEAMMAVGLLTREGQADPTSGEYRQALDAQKNSMDAIPAYLSITTPGNARRDQLEAGRRWVRSRVVADLPDGSRYENTVVQLMTLAWGQVISVETMEDLKVLEHALDIVAASGMDEAHATAISG